MVAKRKPLLPIHKCCICEETIDIQTNSKGEIAWTAGHNALPIKNGRSCTICNDSVVIPQRIANIYARKEGE